LPPVPINRKLLIMSYRLKNRNLQVPGGYKYYLPITQWKARPWASFNEIVDNLIAHLKGNPAALQSLGWSTDRIFIEDRVDEFNAAVCVQMGANDYVITAEGGAVPSVPFPVAPALAHNPNKSPFARLQNVVEGSESLVDWIKEGAQAVPGELSNQRAATCTRCPKNDKGDWTRLFTVPVANSIRHELNRRRDMQLSTPYDDMLNVCDACLCPLKLMVHVPLETKLRHLPVEVKKDLWSECWILKEEAAH
jgi:hypothetical protein